METEDRINVGLISCPAGSSATKFTSTTTRGRSDSLKSSCHNGFVGQIFVTKELAFVLENRINVWHYDQSEDGKRITLKGKGSDSVKFIVNRVEACHETVTDWPLEEHE